MYLARELGKPAGVIADYEKRAAALRRAIENYFGATVQGYETYRYYDGNDVLRAWICLPLTVGIFDRADTTIDALFSKRLWSKNGLATRAGLSTFWDRSTFYALRGVFLAGQTEKVLKKITDFTKQRLLGDHVPYAVEAWPEGNQRHLAAESGFYCCVFTEGLFGIRPTGLRSFKCTPRLPKSWNRMALRNVHAFGRAFDLEVQRTEKGRMITVRSGNRVIFR